MMTTQISSGYAGAALILWLAAGWPALSAESQGSSGQNHESATIYLIRGGGGYFPMLGTVINKKFEEQGLRVVDYRYHDRSSAARQIAEAYRGGALPHGVILIGYSLGGCGVIHVARALQKEEIPVRLLFLIETINPLQTVPSNVQECFNLFHFPAFLGAPVRADSPDTKLTNFEAYTDGGLGLEYSHFTMPFVEEVHELIASRLVAAIHSKPDEKGAKVAAAPAPQAAPADPKSAGAEPAASLQPRPKRAGLLSGVAFKRANRPAPLFPMNPENRR